MLIYLFIHLLACYICCFLIVFVVFTRTMCLSVHFCLCVFICVRVRACVCLLALITIVLFPLIPRNLLQVHSVCFATPKLSFTLKQQIANLHPVFVAFNKFMLIIFFFRLKLRWFANTVARSSMPCDINLPLVPLT